MSRMSQDWNITADYLKSRIGGHDQISVIKRKIWSRFFTTSRDVKNSEICKSKNNNPEETALINYKNCTQFWRKMLDSAI